jgi:hypothetical protein
LPWITRLFEDKLHKAFRTTNDDPNALTLDDALLALSRIIYLQYQVNNQRFVRLTRLEALQTSLFKALGLTFPNLPPKRCSQYTAPASTSFIQDYSIGYCYNMTPELKEDLSGAQQKGLNQKSSVGHRPLPGQKHAYKNQ